MIRKARWFKENPERARLRRRAAPQRVSQRGAVHHLFDRWLQVVQVIHSEKHLALFLDFDGTLVPLRRRPDDVKPLGMPLRKILRRLAADKRITVNVISGRRFAELKKLVPVADVRLLGLHGWEGRAVPPLDEERRLVSQAKRLLQHHLLDTPEVWVEDKGLGLAVHYRGASPGTIRRARRIVVEVVGKLGPGVHLMKGHKVWELLPRQIDGKGAAARSLLSKLPANTLPIFVGDDTTDESAFRVLRHGLTIHVGNAHRTKARFLLRNPEEVQRFLRRLEAEIV